MFPFQVRALKQKIETEKGATDYSAPLQKLIYAGKILGKFILSWGIYTETQISYLQNYILACNVYIVADDDPVSKYNIDEKKFIEVMMAKPNPAAAAPSSPATPTTPAPAPATPSTDEPKEESTANR